MQTSSIEVNTLLSRVKVGELISSRYRDGKRPLSWDLRVEGIDVIKTLDGQELRLRSTGQQTPPMAGWTIEILSGNEQAGFEWTLYGIMPRH